MKIPKLPNVKLSVKSALLSFVMFFSFSLNPFSSTLSAQVLLDAHSSSGGATTWSITTTQPNELILISVGGCCSVLDTVVGTVTVNGNNAKYISGIVSDNFFPAYIWAYVATTPGTYSLLCTEAGMNSIYYFNFAVSVYQPAQTLGFNNIIVGDSAANVGLTSISATITTTKNNSLVYGYVVYNDNGATGSVNWNGGLTELDHYYINDGVDGAQADSTIAAAGTYTIHVTDLGATNPYASLTLVAVQPNNNNPCTLTTTASVTANVSCNGASTGNATAFPSGGTTPYTYSWSNGTSTVSISNPTGGILSAGSYTVTVTDFLGCTATAAVTVTQPAQIAICGGGPPTTLTFSYTGSLQTWTVPAGVNSVTLDLSGGQGGSSAGLGGRVQCTYPTSPGTLFNIYVGGQGGAFASLAPGGWNGGGNAGQCTLRYFGSGGGGESDIRVGGINIANWIVVAGGGGGTQQINGNPGAGGGLVGGNVGPTGNTCIGTFATGGSQVAGGLNCTTSGSCCTFTISANGVQGQGANGDGPSVACNGGDGGGGGGAGYWGGGGGGGYSAGGGGSSWTSAVCTNVTHTQGYNTGNGYILITYSPGGLTVTNVSCFNGSNGSIDVSCVSGGVSPYTYSWAPGGATTSTISNLTAGTYTVTITDANGCSTTASATITQPASSLAANATIISNATCSTLGSAQSAPSGGTPAYTYAWSNGATTSSITGLSAGTYTITVTDNGGCTATGSVTITQPGSPLNANATVTNNETCFGNSTGSAQSAPSGGTSPYTYSWSTGATTSSISGLSAGTYTLTVTDNNGCTATASLTITQPAQLLICGGGPPSFLTFSYTGTIQTWTVPGGITQATITAIGATGGVVTTWTPVGGKGASMTGTFIVVPASTLNILVGGVGGNGVGGGGGGGGSFVTTSANAPMIIAGGGGGVCPNSNAFVSIGIDAVTTNNGLNGNSALGDDPANYGVGGVGGNGATNIGPGNGPCGGNGGGLLTNGQNYNCCVNTWGYGFVNGGAGGLSGCAEGGVGGYGGGGGGGWYGGGGGGGYGGGGGAWDIPTNGGGAGSYNGGANQVNVAAFNASGNGSVTIAYSAGNSITVNQNVTCFGGSNGSIDVSCVSGGVSPYTYSWAPGGATTAMVSNLSAGTYTVTVTDANGCTTTASATITQPAASLLANATVISNVICNTLGSAQSAPTGGTPAYTYAWSNGATTSSITGLSAGTYTLTVTDSSGCTATGSLTITQPANSLAANVTVTNNVNCGGNSTGSAQSAASGGTSPYTYSWSNGATTSSISGLSAGTYTLTVTDNLGCTATASLTITQPAQLLICGGGPPTFLTFSYTGTIQTWTVPGGITQATVTAIGATGGNIIGFTPVGGKGASMTGSFVVVPASTLKILVGQAGGNSPTNGGGGGGGGSFVTSSTNVPMIIAGGGGGTTPNSNVYVNIGIDAVTTNNGLNGNSALGDDPANYGVGGVTGNGATNVDPGNGPCGGNAGGLLTNGQFFSCCPNNTYGIAFVNGGAGGLGGCSIGGVGGFGGGGGGGNTGGGGGGGYGGGGGSWDIPTNGGGGGSYNVGAGQTNIAAFNASGNGSVTIAYSAGNSITVNQNVTCFGGSNGSISVSCVSGGVSPYTYSWAPGGATTATVSNLSAGTYTVTVTDANGCTTTGSATITQPASSLLANATVTSNSNCSVLGSAQSAPSGGTPAYTYAWSNGATTSSITGLSAGTYTLTVSDSSGCTATGSVTITQPANSLAATVTVTSNVNCNSNSTGSAQAAASGGTSPYTYSWSNGATTSSITGLSAGTYTITVTDNTGCTATGSVTITEPAVLQICGGGPPTFITFSYTGTIQTWTVPGGITQATITAIGATGGNIPTYTPVGGNGAEMTGTFVVVPASTLNILVGGAGGTSGTLGGGGGGGGSFVTDASNNPMVIAGGGGGVCPNSNGYISIGIDAVTTNNGLNGNSALGDDPANYGVGGVGGNGATNVTPSNGPCAGNGGGLLTDGQFFFCCSNNTYGIAFVNGGAGGQGGCNIGGLGGFGGGGGGGNTGGGGGGGYSGGGGSWDIPTNGGGAGSYNGGTNQVNVAAFNASGNGSITIAYSAGGSITVTQNVTCFGGSNGSISVSCVSGGTSPYTYSWAPGGATTATVSNLSAGTYTVTVTDANGCTTTGSATITQPASSLLANATVTSNASCANTGSAQSAPTGGTPAYTYAWSNGATTSSISSLSAGTYTLTVTDSSGCTATGSVTITQVATNLLANATVTSNASGCLSNGIATSAPSGGTSPYTYLWSDASSQTTAVASGLSAGTYTVLVTDNGGCTATASITITAPATVLANATVTANASGCLSNGIATSAPSGGTSPYTYLWSDASSQTTAVATGLSAGTYTVLVTDNGGCTATASVTITAPATVLANATVTANASGCLSNGIATSAPSGGTSPYTYLWSDASSQTTAVATGLSAGTYTVLVTDNGGCTATASVTITAPAPVLANATVTSNAGCSANGSASSSPSGGSSPYTYSWSNAATTSSISSLSAGTYTLTVTDNSGCTSTASVTITQGSSLRDTVTSIINQVCLGFNSTATVGSAGGTQPYTYSWSPPVSTTASCSTLSVGVYTVTVTDANGCNASCTVNISQPPYIFDSVATQVNISCYGGSNGSATIGARGGTSPYTYIWVPNVSSTATATGLSAGTYSITVKDGSSCSGNVAIVTITAPAALTDTISVTNTTECTSVGSATTNTYGGTSPYTYSWTGGKTTANISGLSAGTYTLTITDKNGCTGTSSVTITAPAALNLVQGFVTNTDSGGLCNGKAWVTVSGGTAGYTYLWTPGGETTDSITGQCTGTYCCKVTDANGCVDSTCVTVTVVENISNASSIKIYPDPNKGNFTVSGVLRGQVIELFNYLGQKLTSVVADKEVMQFDISTKANGVYLVRIRNADGSTVIQTKIVKEQ